VAHLTEDKLVVVAQEDPPQISVVDEPLEAKYPPQIRALLTVPVAATAFFASFMLLVVAHEEPFHFSQ
jgi:hypothetical protein